MTQIKALQAENERLRLALDSANGKLQRIAAYKLEGFPDNAPYHMGGRDVMDAIRAIASGPTGPDWRGMCERAKPWIIYLAKLSSGASNVTDWCEKWLKDYEEAKDVR